MGSAGMKPAGGRDGDVLDLAQTRTRTTIRVSAEQV